MYTRSLRSWCKLEKLLLPILIANTQEKVQMISHSLEEDIYRYHESCNK